MMAKENLAEMPENYDMMDEVKASAVMNETEEQKIVASNVNDNQEGENPPSPKGGAATKAVEENTVNENARDISQPLTVEDNGRKTLIASIAKNIILLTDPK